MLEDADAQSVPVSGDRIDHRRYLDSDRALAAREREFERLTDAAVRGMITLGPAVGAPDQEPLVQRSPDRCIVQLGPVALTIAWLRSTLDSAADGELLVIAWRGIVATGGTYVPDRTTTTCTPVRSASSVWEEVFTAVAEDEASWLWRPAGADIGGYRSDALARYSVDRLRLAWLADERHDVAPDATRGRITLRHE